MWIPSRLVWPFAFVLAAALASCGTLGGTAASATTGKGSDERAQKQRDLAEAKVAVEVTALKQAVAEADAEGTLAEARREVADSDQALQDLARRATWEVDDAKIERDQASYRVEEAKAELAELQAMYQADEFATMTKELVLQRGRRTLEIAERKLQATDQKLLLLREVDQAQKRRELEAKVETARRALSKAERGVKQTQADAALELIKVKHALAKAEAAAAEAGSDK